MREPLPSGVRGGNTLLLVLPLIIGLLFSSTAQGGLAIKGLDSKVGYKNIYNLDPNGNQTICVNWKSGSEDALNITMTIDENITVPEDRMTHEKGTKDACFLMTGDLFPDFGIHDLMVYVSNSHGGEDKDIYIYYEEEPDGLQVDNQTVYVNIDEMVNLTATLTNGTNIKAEWMVSVEDSNLLDFHDVVRQIYHVRNFSEVALHNVSLIVANELTSKVQFFDVCVQHPINSITLEPRDLEEESGTEITLHLKIGNNANLPMGEVIAAIKFGDGGKGDTTKTILKGITVENKLRNMNSSELEELERGKKGKRFDFKHKYDTQGTYVVIAQLTSQTDALNLNVTVKIWDKLDKVKLHLDKNKKVGVVNAPIQFSIEGAPRNFFSYRIDYGDGTVNQTVESTYKQKYEVLTFVHVYSKASRYTVLLHVFNDKWSHNTSVSVDICHPIPELSLLPRHIQVTTVAGNVSYTVAVAQGTVPDDATCIFDSNDNDKKTNISLTRKMHFHHDFKKPGDYNVSLKCTNQVSTKTAKASVTVLAFTVEDFELQNEELWPMNVSTPRSVFFRIKLFTESVPPDGVTLKWDYGDNSAMDTIPLKNWTTEHLYSERGEYNGSVVITHNKHSATHHFSVRLGLVTMSVDATIGLVNEGNFTFTVQHPGSLNFQYRVIFGDDKEESVTKGSSVSHVYDTPGMYRAYVIGWNDTISEEFHIIGDITVDNRLDHGLYLENPPKIFSPPGEMNLTIGVPEGKPNLSSINCEVSFGDDIDKKVYNFTVDISQSNPTVKNYSYQTLGVHNITVNCSNMLSSIFLISNISVINKCFSTDGIFDRQYSEPSTPMMAFTHLPVHIRGRLALPCYDKGPDYYWEIHKIVDGKREYIPITQSYSDYIRLQQGTLKEGLYEISLNISFTLLTDNWFVEKTYLRYRDPNLITGIDGGAIRVITKKDTLIDAAALSYDPFTGMGNIDDLEFTWRCYWINTQSVQALSTRQNQSTPVDCNTFTIPVRKGVLSFLGSRQDTKGFVFEVFVKKGERTSYPARQLIQLLKDAPIIKIRCLINCEMKIAVSTDLSVESMCESCSETEKSQAQYKWTLRQQLPDSDAFTEVPNYATMFRNTGKNSASRVVKSNTLKAGASYRLEVEVTVPGKKHNGFSSLDLLINMPPRGGKCDVTPMEGHALETEFVANCSGWKDEGYRMKAGDDDLQEPKEYSYSLTKDDFFHSLYDHTGATSPTMKMLLAPNAKDDDIAYNVDVKIVDVMRDYTLVQLPIKLKPPTVSGLTDIANLNPNQDLGGGLDGLGSLDFGATSSLEGIGNMFGDLGDLGDALSGLSDLGGGEDIGGVGQGGGSNIGGMGQEGGSNIGGRGQGGGSNIGGMGKGEGSNIGGMGQEGGSNIGGMGKGEGSNTGGMGQGRGSNIGGRGQGGGSDIGGVRQGGGSNIGGVGQGGGSNIGEMGQGGGSNTGEMGQGVGSNTGRMGQAGGSNIGRMGQGGGLNIGGVGQGGGSNIGGMGQGGGSNIGGVGQGVGSNIEGMGQGGGSNIGGIGQGEGSNIGGRGQGAGSDIGGVRQGGGSNIGGVGQGGGSNIGGMGKGGGLNIGEMGQGGGSNTGEMGQGVGSNTGGIGQMGGSNIVGMGHGRGSNIGGMGQGGGSKIGGMGQGGGSNIGGMARVGGSNIGGMTQGGGSNIGGLGHRRGSNLDGTQQGNVGQGSNMGGVHSGVGINNKGFNQGGGQLGGWIDPNGQGNIRAVKSESGNSVGSAGQNTLQQGNFRAGGVGAVFNGQEAQTQGGGSSGIGRTNNQGRSGGGQRTKANILAARRERAAKVREKLKALKKEDRAAVVVAAIIHKGKVSLGQSKSSRNLLKSVNVVSTLASVMNRIPVPEDKTLVTMTMKDGQSDNKWNELWDDYNKPKDSIAKKLMARSSHDMLDILNSSAKQVNDMNGDQLASLSNSLALILQVPEKTTLEAAIQSTGLGLRAAVQLHNLTRQRPYPAKEEVSHGAKGVVSYLGNVLQTTTPDSSLRMPDEITEDTMSTPDDTSDTHYEENLFLMRKNAQANLVKKLQQADATRKVLPKVESAIDHVLKTMETMVVKNEKQLTFKSNALTLSVQKKTPGTINETIRTEEFEAQFVAPKTGQNFLEALKDPIIDTVVFKDNPYVNSVDGSSDDITSSVLQLTLKDNFTVIDAPLKLKIKTPKPPKEGVYRMKDTMSGPSQMMYHRFLLRNSQDSTFIYVRVPRGVTNVTGYLRAGRAPTMMKYDVRVAGVEEEWKGKEAFKIIIPANTVDNGTVYLALKMTFLPGTILERRKREAMTDVSDADFNANDYGEDYVQFNTSEAVYAELENGEYGLVIVTDGCRVWDPVKEIWDAKACAISRFSTPEETFCSCEHSPGKSFATTFYVPPNTIDFSLVFTKFDPSNAAVYGLIIGIVVMYIFGLLWARRQDKRDIERWRVGYLVDNLSTDKYFYLMQVHTGLRKNSGTHSRISFVLAGENGDTGVRILSDGKRSFATGSVMNYILAVPRQLADLSYLRIWHDNSGSGSKASWFLNKIVAEDLQTQQRYIFVCDHWLDVDKEDGAIDRVLPVSVKDDFMTFDKLFSEHARLNITDTHLWLSIFMRPERCTFSRVQRVSCCLALLFLMMISSAMFFRSAAEKEDEQTIRHEVKIGALRFSMTSFYVSLVGLMVTMPPTILLVMIFKSSKPKSRKGDVNISRAKSLQQQDAENDVLANRYRNKPLPHFFVYIAWLMLALIVMTCGFFLILYSMQWGREVSEEWLTSFFMCFAQSVVVMDPLKVVILAILLAFCLRDPFDSKGEIDIQRVETEARLLGKDELDMLLPPEPLPPDVLAKARRRRRKEVRAQSVFLELIQYIIFLFAIYSLSFGNRDDRSFMIHEHIENNLYTGSVNVEYPFEGIQSYDNFFTWAQSTFIPRLFPETDLRGSRLPWRKRLFFSDLTNFRVGPARIRQLRMPRHQSPFYGSQYSSLVSNQNYYGAYSLFSEDVNSYCLQWKKMPCSMHEESKFLTSTAWKYTSSSDVWGLPVAGQYKIYSGGGYMLELNVNYDVSKDMLKELYDNSWLDRRTRAVFVEFTLYNAFVNIMAYVRLAAEFPETGSTIIWHDIMTFRLDQHHGSLGAYVLLCEIVIAVILVMFTITLMKRLWEQKLAFFLHVWQTLDLLTVIWCMIAVVFYVIREINASETLTRFRDNPKKFVNFQHIAVWDNLFIYALGALVFSTTIRILRILGYNKRVTIIAAVLSNSAKDLTGFGIVFGIVFFAYVLSGYILFSAHYYGYHTIYDSMFTIFTYMLGKNIMARLMLIAPIWAQIYFSTLVFFIIFVLLTMFQAIMNNSMTVVRDNLKKVPPPYGLVNVVLNIYRALIRDWLPDSFFKNQQEDVVVMEELRRRPTYQVLSTLRDQLNLAVTVKGAFKKPIGQQFGMDGKMDRGSLEAKLLKTQESKEYGVPEKLSPLDIQLKGRDPGKGELVKDLAGQRMEPGMTDKPKGPMGEKEKDGQKREEKPLEHGGREKAREHGGQRSRDSSGTKEPEHVRVERPQRRRQRIEQ